MNTTAIKEAIILAGGFGTRLKELVNDKPKPMALVNDKPFLDYLIQYLIHHQFTHVIISTGYMANIISDYYSKKKKNIHISFSHEDAPLGTGGAINKAMSFCNTNNVLVLNGDSFFDFDMKSFINSHTTSQSTCSIALRKVDNASRYGAIELLNNIITHFQEKTNEQKPGTINAGVYLINKIWFMQHTQAGNFSLEKELLAKRINNDLYGFEFDGYFIDIGIPQDYNTAQNDFKTFKY